MFIKLLTINYFRDQKGFLLFVLVLLVFRSSFADQYLVPSGSMQPTIEIGDRIYVNKMAYDLQIPFTDISLVKVKTPSRGDIVVFKNPRNNINMVKRLIGLPGDQIEIMDGYVRVNGQELSGSSYLDELSYTERTGEVEYTIKRQTYRRLLGKHNTIVPEGHYFMMGDNRDNSSDSRVWGVVPHKNLLGKAKAIIYSGQFLKLKPTIAWNRFGKNLY